MEDGINRVLCSDPQEAGGVRYQRESGGKHRVGSGPQQERSASLSRPTRRMNLLSFFLRESVSEHQIFFFPVGEKDFKEKYFKSPSDRTGSLHLGQNHLICFFLLLPLVPGRKPGLTVGLNFYSPQTKTWNTTTTSTGETPKR